MKLSKLAIASVFAASVVSFSSMAEQAGNSGTINFTGSVVNTPCNIEQASLNQTVDFGQLSRSALENGATTEKNFDIKFTGCDFKNFGKTEEGEAVAVKSMMLEFSALNYANDDHTLLQTSADNANNVGIGIDGYTFGVAKDVLPNGNTDGDFVLSFTALAKAVDTAKPVAEGQFSAISNFRITYE